MVHQFFLSPFKRFIKTESLAGILLFSTTILALIWANSSYADFYQNLWQYKLGVSIADFELKKPLILWINDGLMAIFFFLIGLELKRELLIGEINTVKKAAFPFIAALGGVLVPIFLYLILNNDPVTFKGWGIPMATDIAFALAILSTLGSRVPLSLKIFLTAFAIIDDIAAVLVIAVFYSHHINWNFIIYGLILIGLLGLLYRKRYHYTIGLIIGAIVWFLFLKSGIHPTIAGVLLALTIPINRPISFKSFSKQLDYITNKAKNLPKNQALQLLSKDELSCIDNLDSLSLNTRSPLQHLEHKLHGLIAYFILPLFAFANAGVRVDFSQNFDTNLMIIIAVSLFLGKFTGVALFSFLSVKLKLTELPSQVNFKQISGIAAIAGVGFTMSIFITNLAFYGDQMSINSSKVGIIIGSMVAGITGYLILRFTKKSSGIAEN